VILADIRSPPKAEVVITYRHVCPGATFTAALIYLKRSTQVAIGVRLQGPGVGDYLREVDL
jgi:hypothetical protein